MLRLSEVTLNEIRAIAAEKGCRLLAVESSGAGRFSVLRLVLERDDGSPASIGECEAVSRDVSPLLDVSDEIAHRYTLEVSSAGLDRKLYSLADAARFVGRRVRVKTETPVLPETAGPSKAPPSPARNLQGILRSVDGDVLTVVDEENRKTYNVRFGDIRLARLDFEWPDRGRRVFPK
jgi:ribosome maturation factor RimP